MNFITGNYKKYIALFIITVINFLFLVKYLERNNVYFFPLAVFISVFQWVLFQKRQIFFDGLKKIKVNSFFILLIISFLFVFLASKNPMTNLNIDRWSVINSFWDNYFAELYAYKAKSFAGNYPGPMPFYFLLMLPFYEIKEYSYVTVIGVFILYFFLKTKIARTSYVLLIMSSFIFLYEVTARSNIFFNSSLIVLSLYYFLEDKSNIFLKGMIVGLLLSTRNVFVIVYGIAFIYSFINKIYTLSELFQIATVSVMIFGITFLPFTYNHIDEFWEINPFIIQSSSLMPARLSFICIGFSLIAAFFVKEKKDIYFLSGICLFLTILVYFIYEIIIRGFDNAFWQSGTDITYFILCIPFLIYFLLIDHQYN